MDAKDECLVGVDYFPEHWPQERWAEDARLMVECGLKVVRIAEFTWSKIQPHADHWNWTWLDDAVEVLSRAGLKVILCTPTACPPPWMVQEYPDILPIVPHKGPMTLGERRHYSPLHAAYREASADLAEKMARRYGQHSSIIGFQIDNELHGNMEDMGPLARTAFHRWLQKRHGSLDNFDKNLGLIFWGQQYSNWSQVPVPAGASHHPGLRAEWCRFMSHAWVGFCRLQADAMRPYIGERVLTTNCYLHRWGMAIDWHELMRDGGLDVFAFDNYSLELYENGFYNDLARSLSQPHWILEQRCGDTGHHHIWPEPPEPLEDLAFDSAKLGARVISFFRWRQGLFGHEQDHGAILDHHGRPGLMFRRVQDTCERISKLNPEALPTPKVSIVFAWPDSWLSTSSPNSLHYRDTVQGSIYRGCYEELGGAEFILKPEDLTSQRLVLVPAKIVHEPKWESAMIQYVQNGGRLVVFPWFFAKDVFNKYRPDYLGEALRGLFGLDIERRILVREGETVQGVVGDHEINLHSRIEELIPDDAEVAGTFSNGPLEGEALLTRKSYGSGEAFYFAGYPDHESMQLLLRYLG